MQNPLLLMMKSSKANQANAFLQFFNVNFWFDIVLFAQDVLIGDGFYDQIKLNASDVKWNITSNIISAKNSDRELYNSVSLLLGSDPKIVVIHTNLSLVKRIFQAVNNANLSFINHAWFITETSFSRDDDNLAVFPTGTLSIVPNYAVNIDDVILDGTNFIIKSVINYADNKITPRRCLNGSSTIYRKIGEDLFRHLINTEMTGHSGDIHFDDQGWLQAHSFIIQNLVYEEGQKFWRKLGHIQRHGEDISPFGIVWPSESISSTVSYGRKKYRIVTNPVKPFVMDEEPHYDYGKCVKDTSCVYINSTVKNDIILTLHDYESGIVNTSRPYTIKCCRGLSLDLLNRLASDLDFDYSLYIVSDRTYGKFNAVDGTWNGMVRDLIAGTAHVAVAAFSITKTRNQVIDFTSTYFFSGFSVLYTEKQRASNMKAFLEPFDISVWFAIVISATLTALSIGIFEWNSPFGLNPWGKKRKQNYTLVSGLTMIYSVLFGHTVKTKSPKAWPSKFLQNLWAFSCIFIIASYTANLAAFIAGKHAGIVYNSLHDSRLLDINVGVLPGSAVEAIVKQINSRLFGKSQNHLMDTTDNAIKKLIQRDLDAYLGDYPILDYARAKLDPDCKLRLLTQTFGEDGYGIALPKGSPLKIPLSNKIQEYHENGYIDDLIDVHFADSRCYKQRIKQEDSRLEVQHHAGSFVMLSVGIVIGVGILFLEHGIFKWLVPDLRRKPGNSLWKSVHLMFFSQRLYRSIISAELIPAHETYREMVGMVKNRDFMKLFQKNTIKTNKMADAAKRKRLNRNFFDIIEKAKWMKEMQDNNLFGDDSLSNVPIPEINEISLKDITQAVDLREFRKQNLEQKHLTEIMLTINENFDPTGNNAKLDWTSPQTESSNLLCDLSSSGTCVSNSNIFETSMDMEKLHELEMNECELCKGSRHDSKTCGFNQATNIKTNNESGTLLDADYWQDWAQENETYMQPITTNGDLFSEENKTKRREICFLTDSIISETPQNESSCDYGEFQNINVDQCLSSQELKPKDSRTFHPRKRQTIHGKGMNTICTNFDVNKLSKEELLLMWKSSEVELNERLEAAIKDKRRLESKLSALKLQLCTPV